jgi:hypothetical protein
MAQISTFIPCSAPRQQENVYTLPPARPPYVRALPMLQLRPTTRTLSTANLPTPFPIHLYPLLLASFVRAEVLRDGGVPLITTLSILSLLFPPRLPLPRNLWLRLRQPCVPHPLRLLVQTIALRGPHSKLSPIPLTATTIFRTSTDMGP